MLRRPINSPNKVHFPPVTKIVTKWPCLASRDSSIPRVQLPVKRLQHQVTINKLWAVLTRPASLPIDVNLAGLGQVGPMANFRYKHHATVSRKLLQRLCKSASLQDTSSQEYRIVQALQKRQALIQHSTHQERKVNDERASTLNS